MRTLRGITCIRFVPIEAMRSSIDRCAPAPIATITITDATPMIIPSEVRRLRIRFRKILLEADRSSKKKLRPSP
jgi:hypothetical protein